MGSIADSQDARGSAIADGGAPGQPGDVRRLRYRVGFFAAAVITAGLVLTLPFSLSSVVSDVLGPPTGRAIPVTPRIAGPMPLQHVRLLLAVTGIDEVQLAATIHVSGHHRCAGCPWSDRVLLVALAGDDADAETLPPSAAITIAPTDVEVSETVRLPLRGHPAHYPFDRYRLVIGMTTQRVHPDGRVETLSAQQAQGHYAVAVQELLPRYAMAAPVRLDASHLGASGHPFEYAHAFEVWFDRPPYLRVLAAMLLILIAAVATYSVFWRSLDDLVVNSGALVLSMWGIRAILTPTTISYVTGVDLALSIVIIFTLGGLCVRSLLFAYRKSQLGLLRGGS